MDYVAGRGRKMIVFRRDDRLEIRNLWYDHTDAELAALLGHFGIAAPEPVPHSPGCACQDCQAKRAKV